MSHKESCSAEVVKHILRHQPPDLPMEGLICVLSCREQASLQKLWVWQTSVEGLKMLRKEIIVKWCFQHFLMFPRFFSKGRQGRHYKSTMTLCFLGTDCALDFCPLRSHGTWWPWSCPSFLEQSLMTELLLCNTGLAFLWCAQSNGHIHFPQAPCTWQLLLFLCLYPCRQAPSVGGEGGSDF